ncbi:hypothetical protein [Achromobacter phage SE2]|nr:hypothetical protein [Achromobacter phage SE2]
MAIKSSPGFPLDAHHKTPFSHALPRLAATSLVGTG